jgi:hypothetical protein
VAFLAELVGPGERAASSGDRAETIDVASMKPLGESASADLASATGPVQFEQLRRG